MYERAEEQREKVAKENETRRVEQFTLRTKIKTVENINQTLGNYIKIAEFQLKTSEELNEDT